MANEILGEFDPDKLAGIMEDGVPIIAKMGMEVVEMAPGRVTLRMPLAGNENHIGIMYAGVLFTLAEVPGGAVFFSTFDITKYVPIVKGVDIRFKKPATTDISVTVELAPDEIERIQRELEDRGKSDFVLECELEDANGQVVAVSRGDYQARATS